MSLVFVIFFLIYYLVITCLRMDSISKKVLYFFGGVWAFSLIGSTFGFFDLYIPSKYTYLLMVLNVIFFTIGFCQIKIRKDKYLDVGFLKHSMDKLISNKWFILLLFVTAFYLWGKVLIFRNTIAVVNSLAEVREGFFYDNIYGRDFIYANLVIGPFFIFLSPLLGYLCFVKKYKLQLFLILFILIGYVLIGAGRFGYIRIAAALVFMQVIIKVAQLAKKKLWLIFSSIFVGISLLIVMLTGARRGTADMTEDSNLALEQTITYFCGPLSAFDYAVKHDLQTKMGGVQLGRLTFSSVDIIVDVFTRNLIGVSTDPPFYDLIDNKQDTRITVGKDRTWNALYTWLLFFYLDFDFLGAIIFPFLFGILFRYIIKCTYKRPTYAIVVLAFFFFREIVFSVIDFGFASYNNFIMLVVLFVLWKRNRQNAFDKVFPY